MEEVEIWPSPMTCCTTALHNVFKMAKFLVTRYVFWE